MDSSIRLRQDALATDELFTALCDYHNRPSLDSSGQFDESCRSDSNGKTIAVTTNSVTTTSNGKYSVTPITVHQPSSNSLEGAQGTIEFPAPIPGTVRFVAISDTHTLHRMLDLPHGDVLLHCGDFCNLGTLEEVTDFCDWISELPFKHKILVCGNHDFPLDSNWYTQNWKTWHKEFQSPQRCIELLRSAGVHILHGSLIEICGIGIYGSPMQPEQPKSRPQMAFGRKRGQELKDEWSKIPSQGVDVLVTHSPPAGVLDTSMYSGKGIGCEELLKAVTKIKPAVHVFGHVHGCRGIHTTKRTIYINAASVYERRGEGGQAFPPIVFDVEK
eukprot:TRINITY_DN49358_c0_g1_i1.p1 TRINITY_DN49358_c0_g1~~TRINITY_DN49358_c0_g1_i1.p1  ORF type:complete len:346 (+),score=36.75 TRINITY_DN49358_c0_g1_i1:49-1038(+)